MIILQLESEIVLALRVDPLTGKLWITENGPDQYDEINSSIGKI